MPVITIRPGTYLIGGPELTFYLDLYFYAIVTNKDNIILIDSGSGKGFTNTIRNLMELGLSPLKVRYIINTHCHVDVAGGDYYFHNTFGTPIIAHEPDSLIIQHGDPKRTLAEELNIPFNPVPVYISIRRPVEKITLDDAELFIYHCPGHTEGSVLVLAMINGFKVLFGGDSIIPDNGRFKVEVLEDKRKLLLDLDYHVACFNRFYLRDNAKETIETILLSSRIE